MTQQESDYYRSKWGKDQWPPVPKELQECVHVQAKKKESVLQRMFKYLQYRPKPIEI